jgi:circadian clock protein KaiB
MTRHVYTLFIAGGTDLASRALANFDRLVADRLGDSCHLTIVDVLKEPRQAREHRVLATPLLLRHSPHPVLRILGDLSEEAKVLTQLGFSRADDHAGYVAD